MDKNLNAWLCKHFDKERVHTSEYGRNQKIPRKGYVTLWDIIEAVMCPVFLAITVGIVVFILVMFPGIMLADTYNVEDPYKIAMYGIGFWIIIGLACFIIYAVVKIVNYKIAVCPLANKPDEYDTIQKEDSKLRPDLKEAEEKMFDDILNH